jgi:zinc/manganese transport system substrate-binding protein
VPALRTTRRTTLAPRRSTLALITAALALALSGCGATTASPTTGGSLRVVAAENFWGSIAAQLGGTRAEVQSIIVNPAQDPHSYEPTAGDARMLATAQLAIVNGVGYDPWASKLLAANPTEGRAVLSAGDLLHLRDGENPHRWYDPANVNAVAAAITADYIKLDPRHAAYYRSQHQRFETTGLAQYHALIAQIARRYAGIPVGASESIFAMLAPALGLHLITPPTFMKAISEGTEVSAQDTLATQRQITDHEIKVWVLNSQNVTPQIQQLNALARANQIPIATVTETLAPASDSFEQWQVAQLERLQQALHAATGR